ncbi:MAG: polysaccharide biosynthesis/export family protein [Taibaiella sp.]|nr:polysaccharide biosynthesis/export family protein [Taibaiella sp.]
MKKIIYLLLVLIAFGAASCSVTKDKKSFTYFNNLPEDTLFVTKDQNENVEQRLKPADVVSIRVATLDNVSNTLFNEPALQTDGYKLDVNGDINFPIIGKVNLKGKTIEEASTILTQKIGTQVKNPIVNVRLLNAQVLMMGEIAAPGLVNISDRKTTLLEAIGRAGDIKATGRKDNVLVIRTKNGNKEYARVNLNNKDAIYSPYYFLHQDDVVVINPTKLREKESRGELRGYQSTQIALSLMGSAVGLLSLYFLIEDRNK